MALKKLFTATNVVFSLFHKPCLLVTFKYKYSTAVLYKMNAIYFINEKGNDKFSARFCFRIDSLNWNKVFNFERNTKETTNVFLTRLNDRVIKLLEKRNSVKKKKGAEVLDLPPINSTFLLNNQPLGSDVSFEEIFNNRTYENLKLRVLESEYDVIINAPIIENISLPTTIRVGGLVYPMKLDATCFDMNKSVFTWFKSLPKSNVWQQCGEGFFYALKEEDYQHLIKLRCIPANEFQVGPASEVMSNSVVEKFSGFEEIEKRLEFTKNKTADDELRIVSYNILADLYVHTKEAKTTLFTYCDPNILELDYRKDLLTKELHGYNADLICLQEVDKKVFTYILSPTFSCKGYEGVYNEKEGTREGCAFFYDTKKFKLLQNDQYFLTKELLNNPILEDLREKIQNNKNLVERLLNLSTQVQVGALECLTNPNQLIVFGNMHLYFHPDADHIRLLQGLTSFRILQHSLEEVKNKNVGKQTSLVLCGDFNSTPECGFHTFLNEGFIDNNAIDWKSKEDEAVENISCSHCLKMKSACGTPKYTNYTSLFKACLDYIYFQTDQLEVKQVVPLPEEEVLQKQVAIPSEYFPSDHLALVADLKFKAS